MREVSKGPRYVGAIMDGNRRWAKIHYPELPRSVGQIYGAERIRPFIKAAADRDVEGVTFWALSTENLNREPEELDTFNTLVEGYFNGPDMGALIEEGIQVRSIGELSVFSDGVQQAVADTVERSSANTGLIAVFALNYSGTSANVRTTRTIAEQVKNGEIEPDDIDADLIADNRDTAGIPGPDLVIRTGVPQGHLLRLSDFPLTANSGLYGTPVLWPDVDSKVLDDAIDAYILTPRRNGL